MPLHQDPEEQDGQREGIVLRLGPGSTDEGTLEFWRGVCRCAGARRLRRVVAEHNRAIGCHQHTIVIQVADDTASGVHRCHRCRQVLRHQELRGALRLRRARSAREQGAQGLAHARKADVCASLLARTMSAIMGV
jgi:hypothetical protein